jgi:hypothetical protein
MIWAEIAPVLIAQIQGLALQTSDPLWVPEWKDEQQTFGSPTVQSKIELEIAAASDVFQETRRTEVGAPTPGVLATEHGMREFTLNVQCKSYDSRYAFWAFEYAERIRTRIKRESVRDALHAVNTAFLNSSAITRVEYDEDGHRVRLANLDLFFRAGFEDTEGAEVLGWIESIALTARLKDPAGNVYPEPPNYTDLRIPPAIAPA